MDLMQKRFWPLIKRQKNGCHEWQGRLSAGRHNGYGMITFMAHRLAYELTRGEIPEGMQIDHLCKNPKCCNPEHLEVVTPEENSRRSNNMGTRNREKTHCRYGHEYTDENTYRWRGNTRSCRECARARKEGIDLIPLRDRY